MWRDPDHTNLYEWSEYKAGLSAMETGAASLSAAMKIIRSGLSGNEPYTHFVLSYPTAMSGGPTYNNPHALLGRPEKNVNCPDCNADLQITEDNNLKFIKHNI
jgi:hypothetical protein